MWGGEGDSPNLFNSKRGAEKADDTPHMFNIGGRMVELYFSPSDQTNDQLIRTIGTADHSLMAGLMLLTRMDLAEAVEDRYANGIDTRMIINDLSTSSEPVSYLQSSGVPVAHHDPDEIFHHKYAIIDADQTLSDPAVITGSHNWSFSADTRNDENTLIIHDADVTNIFRQEFEARWAELTSTSTDEINTTTPALFPNPVSSTFSLKIIYGTGEDYLLTICDIFGRTVWTHKGQVNPGILMHVESLAQGQYILTMTSPAGVAAIPFVKKR
jgi:phosphatidylserine/phosphatidylglycerophosphate/cardiolipin synthase-like enzyme